MECKTLKKELEALKCGNHLACIYKNKKEQFSIVVPFILYGLKNNEKCIYITDENTKREILKTFNNFNPIEGYIDSHQLEILTKEETYLEDGYFDPDTMITLLSQLEEQALKNGYKGLRITGEMTWILTKLPGTEKIIEYEAKLNYFFPTSKCIALCQYNEKKIDPEILFDVVCTHPSLIIYDTLYENSHYLPPDELFARMKGEVHWNTYKMLITKIMNERKAKEEIEKHEREKNLILDSMSELVVYFGEDKKVTWVNKAGAQLIRLEPEDIVGKYCGELWHCEGSCSCPLHRTLETRKHEQGEVMLPGGRVWHVKTSPVYEQDKMIGAVMIARDITEQKQTEEALRAQKEFTDSMIDTLTDTFYIFDPENGKGIYWNKVLEEMSGYSSEEMSQYPPTRFCPPEEHERIKAATKRILEEGRATVELTYITKDGRQIPFEYSGVLIKSPDGNPLICSIGRDITERKKAEELLRASEEKFRTLFENMGVGVALGRADAPPTGRELVIEPNPALQKFLQYTRGELHTKTIADLSHPEDLKKDLKLMDELLSGRRTFYGMEKRYIRKDGQVVWGYLTVSPLRDSQGNTRSIVVTVQDITDRKRAEEALKKSEEKYRQLIESLNEGIWVIDENEYTTYANLPMGEMLGYTVEEMMGKHLFEFMNEKSVEICKNNLERGKRGIKEQYEFEFLKKNGTPVYTTIETSPIFDDDGNYIGAIAGVMDITDRKKAEELLRESEELYRKLMQTSPDAVIVTDLEGHLTHVSEKVLNLHGFSCADELLGKSVLTLIAPEDHEKAMESFEKTLREGAVENVEYTMVKKEGTFIGELNAAVIKGSEETPKAFITTVRDITEKKRTEEQIKASAKEKEVLLREIHHRVKNNLQVISSLLNLQAEHIKDSQYTEMLKDSQHRIRAMALIHEKLYQSENLAYIDFDEYITSLVAGLVWSYGGKRDKVAVKTETEDIALGIDTAIPCGLIINELVSNALKHAFPGDRKGEVMIQVRAVNGTIELTVKDNGVGIPGDIDFRKTESLGLDLVTTLVEYQLDGEITLDRTEGTAFTIIFKDNSKSEKKEQN